MKKHYRTGLLLCMLLAACSASRKTTAPVEAPTQAPPPIVVPQAQPQPPVVQIDTVILALKTKYATYLNTRPDSITNIKLFRFIDKWLNTPYKWGGTDENGIDCSAFIQKLFIEVYNIKIPRTSFDQLLAKDVEVYSSSKYLAEGDIIFFRTMEGKVVSHVGIYLKNDMFINSSSSKGVSIASLQSTYWKTKYVACGRINIPVAKK